MSKGKSMSKRTRTLILACVAVVALGGILAALLLIPPKEGASSSEASSDPSITLLDKSKGADGKTVEDPVKTMTVKLQGEEFTLIKNADGDMVVEAYKDLPIGTSSIGYLINAITTISASKNLGAVENPADFGFDKPLATVNVTYHDDSTYAFEIGAKTPLEDGYYYRVKDSGEVYIVETSLGDEVSQASTAYIGTTLMTAPTKNDDDENGQAVLRDMELSGTARKQTFAFRQVTSSDTKLSLYSYMLTKPYLRGVNSNLAQTLSTFTSLTASSAFKAYPTKEDLTKYGFDKPYTVAKLNTAISSTKDDPNASSSASSSTSSGSGETPQITYYYNVAAHTITVGNKDEDGNYYVMADDIPVIYLVSSSSISSWVSLQYDDVADTMLFMENIVNVKSISLTVDGKETLFELSHYPDKEESDDQLVVKVGDKTYSTPTFRSLYQILMGVARNGSASEKPSGTPSVIFKMTLNGEDAPSTVVNMYQTSASLYTVVQSTGETYTVKASAVNTLKQRLTDYLNGKDFEAY